MADTLKNLQQLIKTSPEYHNFLEIDLEKNHLIVEKKESAADFLIKENVSEKLKDFNLQLARLIENEKSFTLTEKLTLLDQMFQYWHEADHSDQILKLASLLSITLIYIPQKHQEILDYLLSGA